MDRAAAALRTWWTGGAMKPIFTKGLANRRRGAAYGLALLLVAIAFAIRWSIHPALGPYYAYGAFYPVVVIAAYVGGVGPAILAACVAAPLAYFGFSARAVALEGLGFFALTCGVAIILINQLRCALAKLDQERQRAEALAAGNAELFRELNERVANHLQLVAGLLRVEARGRSEPRLADALAEASIRTLHISRIHRGLVEEDQPPIRFDAFARLLLGADTRRRTAVTVSPSHVLLPSDQATSVAVVLMECVNLASQASDGSPAVTVGLQELEGLVTLEVECLRSSALAQPAFGEVAGQVVRAMTDQLYGSFQTSRERGRVVYRLTFPRIGLASAQLRPETIGACHAPRTMH